MIHENSTAAYQEQKTKGLCECFRKKIYDLFVSYPDGLTDREVMSLLSEPDVNNVRPEITRLKEDFLIKEIGKRTCKWTNKKVRVSLITGLNYFPRRSGIKNDFFE